MRRSAASQLVALCVLLCLATPAGARSGLHVSANRLLDGKHRLTLRGVNRSGSEFACIGGGGWSIFQGPSDTRSVRAIASWHINFVRVPVNEDCWLGINGVKPRYGGETYREAIKRYVDLLHRYGIYAEVSLIWAAPDGEQALSQPGAPDADHSPAVWAGMARQFKNDRDVILAPWGETWVDASCFLHGGTCKATYPVAGLPFLNLPYRTAGMQLAVDVMRAAGYRGPIAVPGINFANDLSQWLAYEPNDPLHQLVAEAHVYGKNNCSSLVCLDNTMAPVAAQVPLIFGETGETNDDSECGTANISSFLPWIDAHRGAGYAPWTWNTWHTCSGLITSYYRPRPANPYGAWVKSYYAAHARTTHRLRTRRAKR